jgi:O-antigen/teichoic acid export membrane protein
MMNKYLSKSTSSIPLRLSLKANFSWTLAGNVFYAMSQWGMLVIIAKLGTPETVGKFSLGLAIVGPILEFANLRLRQIQATDAKREYLFGHYFALRLFTSFIALILITSLVAIVNYNLETRLVILAIGLAKISESVSDIFFGLFQIRERMDRIAKSMIIKGSLSLLALAVGMYLTHSIVWGALGMAIAWAVVLFTYDIHNGKWALKAISNPDDPSKAISSIRPTWDKNKLMQLVWLALPMGIATLLMSLNPNIPRYFIERQLGEAELGIFAAVAYFHRAGITIINALGESTSPRLAHYFYAGKTGDFRNLLLKLTGIGAILGLGGVLVAVIAGKELLTFFYRPEYARQDVFVIVMIASALAYVSTFLTYGLTVARYLRTQTVLYTISTVVLVIACFILIPNDGLLGAATALLISRAVHLIGCGLVVIRILIQLEHNQKQI